MRHTQVCPAPSPHFPQVQDNLTSGRSACAVSFVFIKWVHHKHTLHIECTSAAGVIAAWCFLYGCSSVYSLLDCRAFNFALQSSPSSHLVVFWPCCAQNLCGTLSLSLSYGPQYLAFSVPLTA